MCSGDTVLILDVSRLDKIEIDGDLATIEPGAKLKDIYAAVGEAHLLFPGGGCGDVRVGGLVQGGGWGPYSRMLGFTCDSLESFDMVRSNGELLEKVSRTHHSELFWAVSGGGGGNFGIATKFRFRLQKYKDYITQFTVAWSDRGMVRPVIDEWRANFPGDRDPRVTSFCRLGTGDDPPALLGGAFLGDPQACDTELRRLLRNTFAQADQLTYDARRVRSVLQHPEYQPGPPKAAGAPAPHIPSLGDTCAGDPFPHKVSSCFPVDHFGAEAVDIIVDRLARTSSLPTARRYLSLHSLGGAMGDLSRNKTSCFPYRRKPFMLQYQAWWLDMKDPNVTKACMDWVAGFRDAMRPRHTEGAFINFPDYDLVKVDSDAKLKELLRYYYAQNLDDLIRIKASYDRPNILYFPMGIPPA